MSKTVVVRVSLWRNPEGCFFSTTDVSLRSEKIWLDYGWVKVREESWEVPEMSKKAVVRVSLWRNPFGHFSAITNISPRLEEVWKGYGWEKVREESWEVEDANDSSH